tara:strand:+ start:950 stop:1135 length:186 start_codon:yes stop_codon:yes gene_type:complete
MKTKEIKAKLSRSRQRLADWEALRSSCPLGAGYVDLQLSWERERIKRLQGQLFALHCNEQV